LIFFNEVRRYGCHPSDDLFAGFQSDDGVFAEDDVDDEAEADIEIALALAKGALL
jgi:hypothetical protein